MDLAELYTSALLESSIVGGLDKATLRKLRRTINFKLQVRQKQRNLRQPGLKIEISKLPSSLKKTFATSVGAPRRKRLPVYGYIYANY